MKKLVLITIGAATLASAQALIGIRPTPAVSSLPQAMATQTTEVARPLLGYLTDESNTLFSVVGSNANPSWGEPLSLPESTAAAFLPPRQEYILLSSEEGLSTARLSRSAVFPGQIVPHAMAQPDQVAFSPSGESVALFSQSRGFLEVITGLPSAARVSWSLPVSIRSELIRLAVSDDGELVAATWGNQPVAFCSSHNAAWQTLSTNFWPDAWTFLPATHDLAISDRTRKTVAVVQHIDRAPIAERVLAHGVVDANLLASNRSGTELLAVKAGTSESWALDLTNGSVTPTIANAKINSLTLLRDGQTFLISVKASPGVVVLSDHVHAAGANVAH